MEDLDYGNDKSGTSIEMNDTNARHEIILNYAASYYSNMKWLDKSLKNYWSASLTLNGAPGRHYKLLLVMLSSSFMTTGNSVYAF